MLTKTISWPLQRFYLVDLIACREDATERLLTVATIKADEWPGWLTRLKDWLTWRIIYAGNGAHPPDACIFLQCFLAEAYDLHMKQIIPISKWLVEVLLN